MRNYLLISFLLVTNLIIGQDQRGVQIPTTANKNVCKPCVEAFRKKPKEVGFNVIIDKREAIYLEINDIKWIKTVFKNPKDGVMVDMVSRDRYSCDLENLKPDIYGLKGVTLPIVSGKRFLSGLKKQENGRYKVKLGTIPVNLRSKELEFNLYFIKDNFFCYYSQVYNLKSYSLELLDPGMYLDDFTYTDEFKNKEGEDAFKIKYKQLKFVIPFEKNKAKYSEQDIKPMYDSLELTKFDIKKINIKAYSSVEGSLKRNIELQEQRANSIANALQTFQKPTIENTIEAQENWVDFFEDIQNSSFASLAGLSKQQIKAKLVGNTSRDLEMYLQNHRKAVITLELEKKDPYKKMTSEQLFNQFSESIAQKNIEIANKIHEVLFNRIKKNVLSPDDIKKLDVPNTKELLAITIKNVSIKHLLDARNGMIVYKKLKELEKQYPNNKKIKYNIVATKFVIWRNQWAEVNPKEFQKQIYALKKYGISELLVNRLVINFNIIKSNEYYRKGDYSKKDGCIDTIYKAFVNIEARDSDYLNLAQYFATYARKDLSFKILDKKIKNLTVDEDLLFYYLNLTIIDKELTKTSQYRTIMFNALSQNKERFCNLFNQYKKNGGVTFQLLENDHLRSIYCENCN